MRSYIVKGFLPWIVLFAFADGSLLGLKMGVIGGLLCLLVFNRRSLKKKFILDWATLIFFAFLVVTGASLQWPFILKYSLLLANIALMLICFFSVVIRQPFTLQYARQDINPAYWKNPILIKVSDWIAIIWGFAFLFSSIAIGIAYFGIQNKLWLIEIIPTAAIIFAIAFTILFPDIYKKIVTRKGGIASIPGISEVRFVTISNMNIAYRILGKGPILLMLNGSHMNMHGWDPDLLKKLSEHYQLIIIDYPGVGYSTLENMPFTTEAIANCINRFVEKLEIHPFAIVGYSMGGKIAQEFAIDFPHKTRALILISSDYGSDRAMKCSSDVGKIMSDKSGTKEEKGKRLLSLLFPKEILPRYMEKLQKIFLAAELEGHVSPEMIEKEYELEIKSYETDHLAKNLKQLEIPVLIMTGDRDEIVPAENAKMIEHACRFATLVEYKDAGHGVIYQYPYDIAEQIKTFLEKNEY